MPLIRHSTTYERQGIILNLNDINPEAIQWDEQYNIGVEVADRAHRQLFAIVGKIIELLDEEDRYKNEFACKEGLKFFKNYALQHFVQEEAYMLSIHYKDYDKHKAIHEKLKTQTLPELECDLIKTNYSFASIQRFLGVCIGWLTTHIMMEDRAITGRSIPIQKINLLNEISQSLTEASSKNHSASKSSDVIDELSKEANISVQPKDANDTFEALDMENVVSAQLAAPSDESIAAFSNLMKQLFQSVFNLHVAPISHRYNGWDVGKAVYYELRYKMPSGSQYSAVWMLEETLIFSSLGKMLGIQFHQTDEIVLSAMKEIAQMFMLQISSVLSLEKNYTLDFDRLLSREQFEQVFHVHSPRYSLLFETPVGHFSFCLV